MTARPVTLAGVELPAGAELVLLLAGAFDDRGRHLAFGFGRHFCLGAGLARLEAAVVLRTVATHLPELRLASVEPPPMLQLLSFRAPLTVPVSRHEDDLAGGGAGLQCPMSGGRLRERVDVAE